jgi:DNA invertase Pin-like site-specific DNA recombinase
VRVLIYSRVNTRDQDQDIDAELAQMCHLCKVKNWAILDNYIDYDSRVKFGKALCAASYAKPRCDVFLFWNFDQITGDDATASTLEYLQRLRAHGVTPHSFSEQHLVESAGMFQEVMIVWLICAQRFRLQRVQP